jgi:xylan 1,4-beta-xylosidase
MKFITALFLAILAAEARGDDAPAARTFQNPILPGFHADPSICRAGDDYYLVNSSFEYFPGVPIFHSRDLVHWRQIGHCLTRPSQLPLEKMRASAGIYAPTIRYYDGTFYMVTTNVWGTGNFYVTATDPAGPWSEPTPLDREGIDPSLFFDDDGKVYYTRHVGGGDGYVGTQELDLKTGKLVGEMKNVWGGTGGVWAEGPHLYKINGRYYIMIAEGGTSFNHKVTISRSDSPWGPFESCPHNPILTHAGQSDLPIQALGHADLVETPAGWWAICLGIRPQGGPFHHIGRETFLAPVAWSDDGWPTMGDKGRLELEMPAPSLPPHPWPDEPERDDFSADKLALAWEFLRNPRDADWSLTARPGFLRLNGSAVTLAEADSPAFVGRRQMSLGCRVATRLEFEPERDGDEAGLVIRGNDKHHAVLGVGRRDGKRVAFLRRVIDGAAAEPIEYHPLSEGPLTLSVEAEPLEYRLSCQVASGETLFLGAIPTRDFSSERIGGFTGAYFGMYATGNGEASTTPADFDWFDYKITQR